jgi:L-threonylcarbamoyladenylate synthase
MKKPAARIYRPTARNLKYLAQRLRAGELVAVPTETVYGLAANVFDANACEEVFRVKGRPHTDPLIVHVHDLAQLNALCVTNSAALKLAGAFWPGPLTLVLPKQPAVPGVVTAGRSSVAIRMPGHRVLRRLLELADVPLAAPSANPFGYVSPTTAEHVRAGLGARIRHILDGGPSRIGLESTIIDLRAPDQPRLLRPGAITAADLERVLKRAVPPAPKSRRRAATKAAQLAPGLLARHYSPKTPVITYRTLSAYARPDEAYLCIRRPGGSVPKNVFWLDARGNLRAAARRLFAMLRELDGQKFKTIHVELAPGDGLAEAINDRLRRAAAR